MSFSYVLTQFRFLFKPGLGPGEFSVILVSISRIKMLHEFFMSLLVLPLDLGL